ncbi:MAG: glycoside hydrolase, partial [Maribacter sp.]
MSLKINYTKIVIILFSIVFSSCNTTIEAQKSAHVLKTENFEHYVDYFNRMEDENIAKAIPNNSAWAWMKTNIPLFE